MKSFKEIKKTSREQLRNNWKIPVLFSLIFVLLTKIDSSLSNGSLVITLTTLVLSFYITKVTINIAMDNKDGSIKVPARHMLRTIGLGIIYAILYFIINMVSLLGLGYLLSTALSSGIMLIISTIVAVLMMVALLFIDIIVVSYVSFSTYLIYSKDCKIFESIKLTFKYLKGNFVKTAWLVITFVPWILLGVITLGIGFAYVMPYLEIAFTNYCIELEGNFKNDQPCLA